MYQKPLPEELLWAVDADAVLAALKPYVVSNGSAPAPTRSELFKLAYIAHARISVGPNIGVSPSEPASEAGKPPRAAQQIADVVGSERLVMLQALYREYLTHLGNGASRGENSGHVVLTFSISPNGQVTHSRISSATFLDPRFNTAVEELVRQTEFAPLDVAATDVKDFDISFGPW
jgi:TonB family protein